jgi:hypothetical protein
LKAELASKHAELEAECQGHQVTEVGLHTQVGESEQRKDVTLAALKEASEKSDCFKKDCEGAQVLPCFFCLFPSFFIFWFSNLYIMCDQLFEEIIRSSRMILRS